VVESLCRGKPSSAIASIALPTDSNGCGIPSDRGS
jgi:hypothetical protein